jgi:hypothetical protein
MQAGVEDRLTAGAPLMLPTEDLFVYVYVLIDDLIASGAVCIPPRPGPAPACSDAGLLAIAVVRHLLGRRSEAGFPAEVARDWAHLFPRLPLILQRVIAEWRNRVEATFGEITDLMELARHGGHSFWGLLTRTAATAAAHALLRTCLAAA